MYITFTTSVIPSKILIFLLMLIVSPSEEMIIYMNKILYEKIANISYFHSLLFKKKAVRFMIYLLFCIIIQLAFLSFLLNFNEINTVWRKPVFYYGSIYILIDIFGVNFCIVFIAFILRFFTFSLKLKM